MPILGWKQKERSYGADSETVAEQTVWAIEDTKGERQKPVASAFHCREAKEEEIQKDTPISARTLTTVVLGKAQM